MIVLSDSDEYVSEDSDRDNKIGTKNEKKDEPQLDQHATADTAQKDANDENDDFVMYVDLVAVYICVMVAVTPYISRVWLKTYKRISRS